MDTSEAAHLLSVAEHEIAAVRQHAEGWWEALHHDMASHEETWRPLPTQAGWWEAKGDAAAEGLQVLQAAAEGAKAAADAPQTAPETVDDDPDGPGVDTDGDGVPEGSAKQVLDWVGEDVDKAKAALTAEQAKDKPRAGLVAALEKLVLAE